MRTCMLTIYKQITISKHHCRETAESRRNRWRINKIVLISMITYKVSIQTPSARSAQLSNKWTVLKRKWMPTTA
jgi:hypothetical protein